MRLPQRDLVGEFGDLRGMLRSHVRGTLGREWGALSVCIFIEVYVVRVA